MKWPVKKNMMLYYHLITIGLTVIVSLTVGTIVARESKHHLITSHVDMYSVFVSHILEEDREAVNRFFHSPPHTVPPDMVEMHLETLLRLESVIQAKVWNTDHTVLWSDQREIIGKRFPDNELLREALKGKIVYEKTKTEKEEHFFENGGLVLEFYLPVSDNGEVVGAIELYESDPALRDQINRLVRLVWTVIIAGGFTLYAMLFLLFYRSYKRQKMITEQVKQTEQVTIYALAYQAGLRDEETGRHLKRTTAYVRVIAEELRNHPGYKKYITEGYIEDLGKSAPLHDIGKVGIPDAILQKPGKLTAEEFTIIKQHCRLGARILEEALEDISFRSFLDIAIQIARYHHEKWDGSGYPEGLKGDRIPLSARIMALADVYDALRSKRYYKKAFPHEKSVAIIQEEKGRHFDPMIVEAFLQRADDFYQVSVRLADE